MGVTPEQEGLVGYANLDRGGLYTFQGVDSDDSLSLWSGEKTNKDAWVKVGELMVNDVILVVERAYFRWRDRHLCVVDVVWKNGNCWFSIDYQMCPPWKANETIKFLRLR